MIPASLAPGHGPIFSPIILLVCSNLFMTIAWYGHLKFKSVPAGDRGSGELGHRLRGILLRRPANRIGSAVYSPAELKTIQEVITLVVFAGFTVVYFKEPLSLTQGAGFAADRARRDAGVSRPSVNRAARADCGEGNWVRPPDGCHPRRPGRG